MTKRENKVFVNEFIPKVSRTFSLAIKFLPASLRHSVFTAYLLCRVADTIEDSPYIQFQDKLDRLSHLKKLLMSGADGAIISSDDIVPLYRGIDPKDGADHLLLGRSRELFEVLNELREDKRQIIYRWAGEMAEGMAEFVRLTVPIDGKITVLENTDQWDQYCYYVAGTVGYMLTELFIAEYDLENGIAEKMKLLCSSFGLGLQKVNTIKDAPNDRARRVLFLPKDIMVKHGLQPEMLSDSRYGKAIAAFVQELVNIASSHLNEAIEYTILLPESLKGIRMFLTVPVFLARETLNIISKNPVQTMVGPPVKISRKDVIRLTSMARLHSPSNESLNKYYAKLVRVNIPV